MNEIIIDGYLAEVVRLQAERKGLSPEEYVQSFFLAESVQCTSRCAECEFFIPKGAMHQEGK